MPAPGGAAAAIEKGFEGEAANVPSAAAVAGLLCLRLRPTRLSAPARMRAAALPLGASDEGGVGAGAGAGADEDEDEDEDEDKDEEAAGAEGRRTTCFRCNFTCLLESLPASAPQ